MEPEEVRRQVDEFAAAGLGGVMIHSRTGLLTPYMGEEWFKAVESAVDQARRRGITVWLYDEDKWPSGFSGGAVVANHPEYRMIALTARPVGMPTPTDCVPIGAIENGLQAYVWRSPLGHEHFNGTCYASLLNPDAMRKFLDLAYEPYHLRFGTQFGGVIPAIFTDEPAAIFRRRLIHPALPYAANVPETFSQMFGYDPVPHLTKLFLETEGYRRFRLHYHRVINHLFETSYTQQLGEWCRAHGIALTGHFVYEQGLYEQQLWGVDIMPNYRHMDIPGIDHLGCQIHERVTAIQCRSVANQFGKQRVMSELYGAAGQDLSFEDRKWIAEQQICLGVNQFVPHLSLYTLSGCRKRDFPPTLSPQQPWWPQNRLIDDHLSRLCAALVQGEYQAEMAILHPQESIPLHWTPIVDQSKFKSLVEYDQKPVREDRMAHIDAINQDFKSLTDELLGAQRTFDYVHEKLLEEDGRVERTNDGPRLVMGQARYPLVIMPSMTTIRPCTLELLMEFIEAGGTVIQTGLFPELVDAVPDERLRQLRDAVRVLESRKDLASILAETRPPAVEVEGRPSLLWIHRRQIGAHQLLFLVNLSRREGIATRLCWRNVGGMTMECLNPTDGSRTPQPFEAAGMDGLLALTLAPGESRLFQTSSNAGDVRCEPLRCTKVRASAPSHPIIPVRIERLDDNALVLDTAHYRLGDQPWSIRPVPLIAIQEYLNGSRYAGPLTLRFIVESRLINTHKVHLIAERSELWKISVNGQPVSYGGLPCWHDIRLLPIDIGNKLTRGMNVIECHITKFHYGDLCCFDNQPGRYGTELESLMIIGDFGVEGKPVDEPPVCPLWEQYGLRPPGSRMLAGPFALVPSQPLGLGDVTSQGLPFYAGRLRYEYHEETGFRSTTLMLGSLEATAANVAIDGNTIGGIAWSPFTLHLTDNAGAGKVLVITLHNSLRNLLGPHHHPQGLMPVDSPGAYTADPSHVAHPDGSDQAWVFAMDRGESYADWNHFYVFRQYGLTGPVWLKKG